MKMSRAPLTPRESLENRSPKFSSFEANVAAMKGLSPREMIYSGHVRSIKSRWEKYADSTHEEKCNSKPTRYNYGRLDEKGQENTCFQSRSDSLTLQKVSERNMIGRNPVAGTYALKDNPWMKKACSGTSDEKESTILKGKNVPEPADDPDSSLMTFTESLVSIPWKKPDLKVDCTRLSIDDTWMKKVNKDEEAELEYRVLKDEALPCDDSPASADCEKNTSTSEHYTPELTGDLDSISMSASGSTASLPRKKPDLKVDTTRQSMDNAWVKKDNNEINDKTADRGLTKKESPANEKHNSTNYKKIELSRCISSDSSTLRHYIDKFADVADSLSLSASGSPTSLTRKKPDLSVDTARKSMSWSSNNIREELSQGKLIGNMLLDIQAQISAVDDINGASGGTVLPSSGSVDSSTSSLVYSVGNTIESYEPSILQKSEKTYQYFGSNCGAKSSDSDDDIDPSDLIASTLAECRLLLQMSPPPTPLLKPTSDQISYSFKEFHQINKYTDNAVGKSMDSLDATTLPSLDSKTSSFAFSKLGRCPSCDEYIQDEGENTPLRSVLCGHVVCHKCIFSNKPSSSKKSIVIDCPECEVKHDLDHWKPVLGMGLCDSSKEINVFHNRKPSKYYADISSENKKVPTQIHLFSPSNICHTFTNVTDKPVEEVEASSFAEAKEEGDKPPCPTSNVRLQTVSEENESKSATKLRTQAIDSNSEISHSLFDDVDRSVPSSSVGDEPSTPVSRAEFRFLQQKQKLAQSLEQINQILQKSKSRREQLAKDIEKKSLKEETEVEMKSKGFEASEKSYDDIRSIDREPLTEESNLCCDEKLGDPFDAIKEKVRKKVEAAFQEQYQIKNEETTHDEKKSNEVTNCQIDCHSRDSARVGVEKSELSTVKELTDHKSANRRRLPQLSIDTGFGSYGTASEIVDGTKPDTSPRSNDPKPMDRLVTSQNDLVITIDRNENKEPDSSDCLVFRTNDGYSVSDTSSLSGRHDENMFLLSDKHKIKLPGNAKSKIKECIATTMEKSSGCHQNSLSKEKQCHQFLPSLNYSILQDSSRFENKGNLGAQNKISVQKRLELRRKTRHESMSITQGSIRDVFRHNGMRSIKGEDHDGNQRGRDSATRIDQNFTSTVCDGRDPQHGRGLTYEFSEASSLQSLFDDEGHGGLNGELITHKPKLHKKIFGKLGLKKSKKK